MAEEDTPQFMANLVVAASDLLQPLSLAPPSASERAALQANAINVAGKHVDVSPLIQQEICKLSDEFHVSEKTCFEFWFMASDQHQREWVERADQLAPGTIADSVQSAVRYFLISEIEYKLHLLKELLRLRLETQLDKPRAQFINSLTNKMVAEKLVANLLAAYRSQLVQLAEVSKMEQRVSFWHTLVADCLVYIVSSTLMLATEVQQLAELLKTLCGRLKMVVARVSPHIVNLSSFAQLFEGGYLADTSPEGAVRQAACILQTITAVQVALFVVLLQKTRKMDRETGEMEIGAALCRQGHAPVVKELHRILYEEKWEEKGLQSVAMLAWAGFLANNNDSNCSNSNVMFVEAEAVTDVVKNAIEEHAFHTLVEVQLKYLPDRKRDVRLYNIYEQNFELLFRIYSSKMMVDVPTVADKAALAALQSENDGEIVAWDGDCLEDIVEFAMALCARNATFCCSFWHGVNKDLDFSGGYGGSAEIIEDDNQRQGDSRLSSVDGASCHVFLLACRDAAFKNPGCVATYIRLVAAAACGPGCAQLAFHHVKTNPHQLSWDQFFAVMSKYQRLLTDAEKPAGYSSLVPNGAPQVTGIGGNSFNSMNSAMNPGPRFIRPKELEALESIHKLIQEVIYDPQLALIFFHNHDWSPIPTFVAFLQCRIPSSLKGSIMKTLAAFARVPDIAPFVWRQVDALQILRTTGDTLSYGKEDISYELEHYESLSRTYPATRGFVTLLYELFENPYAWKSFEGDGHVAAIQYYFEFLLENVFIKFDMRKYEREEEKWALVNGTLAIFKKILRNVDTSTTEGSLSYQLLARFLSSNPLLNKVLSIISGDGGVDNLESTSTDMHLEHAFFYCLDIVKRETEAKHGSLNFVIDVAKRPSDTYLTKTTVVAALRERCVQHALELILLILEKDVHFVNADHNRQLSHRLQVEMMHTILCRHRSDLVNIVKYIKYSKSTQIPHLSTAILRMISARMSGEDLVDLLIDSGSSADIVVSYINRLLYIYDDDEKEQVKDEVGSCNEQGDTEMDSESMQSRKWQKPHCDTRTISSPYELFTSDTYPVSIRGAILDLLLDNLSKPAPNLAHLLLGNINSTKHSNAEAEPRSLLKTGLAAVINLVSNADFGLETPELAERCYHILYSLIAQEFSSSNTIATLESVSNDYFATQIHLFSSVYHVTKRKTAAAIIAELNMRGWFFKMVAVYLHMGLHKVPPHMKSLNKLTGLLLSVTENRPNDFSAVAPQEQMLLLRLLDQCSFQVSPPLAPTNQQVLAIAEQVTTAVGQGCYYKWLKIDVKRFCQALQTLDLTAAEDGLGDNLSSSTKRFRVNGNGGSSASSQNSTEIAMERFIQWAVQWNIYSERIAAESHALNSLRELLEVIVLDYLILSRKYDEFDSPAMWESLDALASEEVRLELMSGIVAAVLSKLTDKTGASAQLFEIVSRIALMLFSQLSYTDNRNLYSVSRYGKDMNFLELLFRSIYSSAAATGNPLAARNSRTLLYTSILHVLHLFPSRTLQDSTMANIGRVQPQKQRVQNLHFNQVIDLICQDASDSEDTLSMALAVSALESLVAYKENFLVVAIFRERGYLLHFIDIFKKLSDMDAAVFEQSSGGSTTVKRSGVFEGLDATTIGSMYECFLSLFARIAETQEGAVALLEGGLIRVLSDARNLPTHRPQNFAQQNSASSVASVAALQRIDIVYYRKWLPVARLLSACCASLPKNRALTRQTLIFVNKNRKLFTSALKLCASSLQSPPISINLLREVSYVTFVFRYVTQFPDLCEQTLAMAKWEKISQLILQVFMYFSAELVPPNNDPDEMNDRSAFTWWNNVAVDPVDEQRDDVIYRGSFGELDDKLSKLCDTAAVKSSGSASLLHMSLLDEEKLYASRMILCNSVAFCASRMMLAVGDLSKAEHAPPLLSLTEIVRGQNKNQFPSMSMVDPRAFVAATDPLWTVAPSIDEFTTRFDSAVFALEASKQLVDALTSLKNEVVSACSNSASSSSSQQALIRRRDNQFNFSPLESVLEYHADSLAFVVENMLVVLLCHIAHYLGSPDATSKEDVYNTLGKLLAIVSNMENNSFVHAIARKLRELASRD